MISGSVRNHIGLGLKLARKYSNELQAHHAAVLAKGRKVISIGVNQRKTHTKSNSKFGFIHAELDCVLGVDEDTLKDATLYVVRVGYWNRKEIMYSRPCCYCRTMLIRSGVRKVVYTIDKNRLGVWNPRNGEESIVKIGE